MAPCNKCPHLPLPSPPLLVMFTGCLGLEWQGETVWNQRWVNPFCFPLWDKKHWGYKLRFLDVSLRYTIFFVPCQFLKCCLSKSYLWGGSTYRVVWSLNTSKPPPTPKPRVWLTLTEEIKHFVRNTFHWFFTARILQRPSHMCHWINID